VTPARLRALTIVRDYGPIRPREFARKMWPDSPRWKSHTKCGNHGVSRGGGMSLAGGGFLGKLYRDGLVNRKYNDTFRSLGGYYLTDKGHKALEEATDA